MNFTRVVAITGCDSGLGWALAARSAREGLVTVAGMYNGTDTKAANALRELCAHPCALDVTKPQSVANFRSFIMKLLSENPNYRLYAIVNNAGIMTIGDYEWQTTSMIESTINVNLLGPLRVISTFIPDLRKSALEGMIKPRVINVASHCGLQPLPGFGPYSASKAGLLAVTRALRLEQLRHGLTAVAFIPGGFIDTSNLMSSQVNSAKAMLDNLNDEQKNFYAKRINSLADYLKPTAHDNKSFDSLKDENIIETFMQALNADHPKELYKVESWRYKFYYTLLKLPLPETVRLWIIQKFLNFPKTM